MSELGNEFEQRSNDAYEGAKTAASLNRHFNRGVSSSAQAAASSKVATASGAKAAGASAAGAASKGAAAGPVGAALAAVGSLATSEKGRKFLAGLLVLILLPVILISAMPTVIWNMIWHIDETADPIGKKSKELALDGEDLQKKEKEFADIIMTHLYDSRESVDDKIINHCRQNDVDYELSSQNIVDNTMISSEFGSAAGFSGSTAGAEGAIDWAISTAKSGKYSYKRWKADRRTHQCPICHPGSGNGWNCIGFITAAYYHGAGVKGLTCANNGFGGDPTFNKITEKTWKKRNGPDWQMISNGKGKGGGSVPESALQRGDVLLCYTNGGGIYKHTAMYIGNGKYIDSTSGRRPNIGTGVYKNLAKRRSVSRVFRYTGSAGSVKKDANNPVLTPAKYENLKGSDIGSSMAGDWAVSIAANNSFSFGLPDKNGGHANHSGCYFCGTNTGPNLYKKGKSKKYEKTYNAGSFVTAAYAHGAGEPALLKLCTDGKSLNTKWSSFEKTGVFKKIKAPSLDKLKKGDIVVKKGHIMIYTGDGQLCESTSSTGDYFGPSSISVLSKEKSKKAYRNISFVARYTGKATGPVDKNNKNTKIKEWTKKIADDNSYVYGTGDKKYLPATFVLDAYGNSESVNNYQAREWLKRKKYQKVSELEKILKTSDLWTSVAVTSPSELQVGDVIFYGSKQCEIYYGNKKVVGARKSSSKNDQISIKPLYKGWSLVMRFKGADSSMQLANITHAENLKAVSSVKAKNQYEKEVWVYLREKGYSEAATAGIMGNMWCESGYNPNAINKAELKDLGEEVCGIGVFQWSNGRNKNLRKFAKSLGKNWNDLYTQMRFFSSETKSSYTKMGSSEFKRMVNVKDATIFALDNYVYAGKSKDEMWLNPRYAAAKDVLKRYKGVNIRSIYQDFDGVAVEGEMSVSQRQVCQIISAFSVSQDQLTGGYKGKSVEMEELMKKSDKAAEKGYFAGRFFGGLIGAGKGFGNGLVEFGKSLTDGKGLKESVVNGSETMYEKINNTSDEFGQGTASLTRGLYLKISQWSSERNVKKNLEEIMKKNKAEFFSITYGDIEMSGGTKYYTSITIDPAPIEDVMNNAFGVDPDAIYMTKDGQLLGAKDTTNWEAVESLTNNHMEMLYDNHDEGNGMGYGMGSSEFGSVGGGKIGNPLGSHGYVVTSRYGPRIHPISGARSFHTGLDMAAASGTKLYAAESGKVVLAGSYGGYGQAVKIRHENGLETLYGHMLSGSIRVRNGEIVKRGQLIGLMGSTGNSTGPHLHFEVLLNGKTQNPLNWFTR